MEVWNPLMPFKQTGVKAMLKRMVDKINGGNAGQKQRKKAEMEMYKLEKEKPKYKTTIK